jgi:hypothetical protein
MATSRLAVDYATARAFVAAYDREIQAGSITVPGAAPDGSNLFDECVVEVRVGGGPAVAITGWMVSILDGDGLGVMLGGAPPALAELADRLRATVAAEEPVPAAEPVTTAETAPGETAPADLGADAPGEDVPPDDEGSDGGGPASAGGLSSTEKMRLALSGTREERLSLLRDLNKLIHVYVLRNPRIQLDEVQYAAKLTGLSPDAMKLIAEHRQWGADPVTCSNIVRNPRSPLHVALKVLDRVPVADLRILARGAGRAPLVQAARKKLNI